MYIERERQRERERERDRQINMYMYGITAEVARTIVRTIVRTMVVYSVTSSLRGNNICRTLSTLLVLVACAYPLASSFPYFVYI